MVSNRLVLAGLAALCVTAAAAGGDLTVRQNATGPESTLIASAPPPSLIAADPGAAIEAPDPVPARRASSSAPRPAALPSSRPAPPRTAPVPETFTPSYDS